MRQSLIVARASLERLRRSDPQQPDVLRATMALDDVLARLSVGVTS